MKKENYIPFLAILGIVNAEMAMYFGEILPGLGIHITSLLTIVFIIIFSGLDIKIKNVLQGLTLLILLRIINLATPQFFTTTMLQYPLIYGVMFIPIYYVIKGQEISTKELGINFKKLYIYIPLAVTIGAIAAIFEYRIMNPIALIDNIRPLNIILISIIMIIFIGVVEEVIFRSILQTRLEKIVGWRYGILTSGIIFGIMNASYGISTEIVFAIIFGIVLGYIFYRTKNITFNVLIHGVANVATYGILPFYGIYIMR